MSLSDPHPDDDRYAPRIEIAAFFREVNSKLDRIELQVTQTNGRVRAIEIWKAGVEAVRIVKNRGVVFALGLASAGVGALLSRILST